MRAGVQLIHDELSELRAAGDAAPIDPSRLELTRMRKDEFRRRRRQLMKMMGRDAIAILPAAPVRRATATSSTTTGPTAISST